MTVLSLYGLSGASSTLATAAKLASGTGGSATTVVTSITAGSGFYELLGLGGTSGAVGSLPAPTGKGWLFDVTTLEAQTLLSGNYSLIETLNVGSGTLGSLTLTVRVYKRSSAGVYTLICSGVTSTFTMTTTPTAETSSPTGIASMAFATGDKVYVDAFLNGSPAGTRAISVSVSSTASGIANDGEIDTPGYQSSGTQHTLDAQGRFSLKAQQTRSGQGRFFLKAQKTRNAQGRFSLKAQKTRSGQGRFSLRAQKTRSGQGRFSLKAQRTRNAQGRFALSTLGPGIFVFASGSLIQILLADGISIDDKTNARSTASFTVIGSVAAQLQQKMSILIYDTSRGVQLFAGTIESITLNQLTPQNIWLWKVQCADGHVDADKRVYTGRELSGYLAGDAVALMHQKVLAAEGVKANYAMRVDDDATSWGQGTLTNVVAQPDGTLTLAPSGSTFLIFEDTTAQWAVGTLTGVTAANNQLTLASSKAIKMSGTCTKGRGTNLFAHFAIWLNSVVIAAGDYLEYDVWVDSRSPFIGGGVDFTCSDGTTLRDSGATDQNGIGAHPNNDLGGFANDQWYHRHIVVASGLVGKTLTRAAVVLEGDNSGTNVFYVRHAKYYSSTGTLKATFYESGALSYAQQGSLNGYSNVTVAVVTAYEGIGTRVSPAYTNSVCPIVQASSVNWSETDPPSVSSGSTKYPPPVLVELSLDNSATWVTLTNQAALPIIAAGANLASTTWLLRETLSVAGPSPEVAPTLDYLVLSLTPAAAATVGVVNDIDKLGDGSLGTGTLTNLTSSATGLALTGIIHTWDDGSLAGQSVFGGGNPSVAPWRGGLALSSDNIQDVKVRLDDIGQVTNFTLELDLQLATTGGGNVGINYRTTGWGTGLNYAYNANITPGSVTLNKGTDVANTNSNTQLAIATNTFQAGQWFHFLLIVNGNNHQIWLDGTKYIDINDASFPSQGYIGLRYYNNSGARSSGYFDNFGFSAQTSLPITGSRTHSSVSLTSLSVVGDSRIWWNSSIPASTLYEVDASLDAGATWLPCTNGGQIPGLTPGTNVVGKSLLVRELFSSQNPNATPNVTGFHAIVYAQYSAVGTRVSPMLALGSVGRVGSTSLTWDPTTPPGTSVVAATTPDNITYTTIAAPGNPIAGITGQPDPTADGFATNTSANYTSTFIAGGAAGVWTFDTAQSRLVSTGDGYSSIFRVDLAGSFSNGSIEAIMDYADHTTLTLRMVDTSNMYSLYVDDSGSTNTTPQTLRIWKIVGGVFTALTIPISIPFTRGEFHTISFSAIGTTLSVLFDGVQVASVTDASLAGPGKAALGGGTKGQFYSIQVQPLGDDLTGRNAYYKLTLTSTDPSATPIVRSGVLSARGPQIMSGAILKQTNYSYKSVASNIDDASKQSNTWWAIDQNSELLFQNRSAQLAPWAFWTGLRSDGSCDLQYAPTPTVKFASPQYRNRHYVINAYQATTFVDMKQGDGQASSWALSAKIISITSIVVNGATRSFGVQGVDTGKDYYFTAGDVNIAQAQGAIVLAKNEVATITFVGQAPYTAMKQDTAQQALLASLDVNSSGIVEAVEDGTGLDSVAADALAQARITQYAKLARDWGFTTLRSGLSPGQLLPVFATEFNLWDIAFLITAIKTRVTLRSDGSFLLFYDVSCSEGPALGSWARIFVLT
jgi:hypothetical protein